MPSSIEEFIRTGCPPQGFEKYFQKSHPGFVKNLPKCPPSNELFLENQVLKNPPSGLEDLGSEVEKLESNGLFLENQVLKNPPSGLEDLGSEGLGSDDLDSDDLGSEVEKLKSNGLFLENRVLKNPPSGIEGLEAEVEILESGSEYLGPDNIGSKDLGSEDFGSEVEQLESNELILDNQVLKNPPSEIEAGLEKLETSSLEIEAEVEKLESKYKVGEPIGEGGFGSIYNGSRIGNGEKVAIKYVPKDKIEDWVTVSLFIFSNKAVVFAMIC